MPRFVKGSPEAKEHMRKIRAKKDKDETVEIPLVGSTELDIPEHYAMKKINKQGVISFKLIDPLTKKTEYNKQG